MPITARTKQQPSDRPRYITTPLESLYTLRTPIKQSRAKTKKAVIFFTQQVNKTRQTIRTLHTRNHLTLAVIVCLSLTTLFLPNTLFLVTLIPTLCTTVYYNIARGKCHISQGKLTSLQLSQHYAELRHQYLETPHPYAQKTLLTTYQKDLSEHTPSQGSTQQYHHAARITSVSMIVLPLGIILAQTSIALPIYATLITTGISLFFIGMTQYVTTHFTASRISQQQNHIHNEVDQALENLESLPDIPAITARTQRVHVQPYTTAYEEETLLQRSTPSRI
jgi:hypothetical protein